MAYFATTRIALSGDSIWPTARVGITAGRVLGNAVERNRIKRRMREAIRTNLHLLPFEADVILHPRRQVLTLKFVELKREVEKIFSVVSSRMATTASSSRAALQPAMTNSIPSTREKLLRSLLAAYKLILSPVLHALSPASGCRFQPTCSEYAAIAWHVHGPARGSWLALSRVLRCHPFGKGGFDPVPGTPLTATEKTRAI